MELDRERALTIAIAEALERHGSTCIPHRSRLIRGSFRELSQRFPLISISDMQRYLDSQQAKVGFKFRNLSDTDVIDWIQGHEFRMNKESEEIYYPFSFVRINNELSLPFCLPNTSGFALDSDTQTAFERALAEILERDAFLRCWWLKQAPPLYTYDDIANLVDTPTAELLRWVRHRIRILDISDFWGVPIFAAILLGDKAKNEPAFILGGACHRDPNRALFKALKECMTIFLSANARRSKDKSAPPRPPFDVSMMNFDDSVRLYSSDAGFRLAEFILHGPRPGSLGIEKLLNRDLHDSIFAAVVGRGALAIHIDMTPIDLHQAGLHLARAVVPESIPLNSSHMTRPYGCLALRGYSNEQLNPDPQPFS